MIALACDHHGIAMKKAIAAFLSERGIPCADCGAYGGDSSEYPQVVLKAAKLVQSGECERGVVICGTGIGASIAANKVRGIRCALCSDMLSARLTRMHNDSNVIAFGADIVSIPYAIEMLKVWLDTGFEGGRHAKRVEMITGIERGEDL